MPAAVGNQWWKLRAKSGRDKIFSSNEELMTACMEYFEFTDTVVMTRKDWVGKDAEQVTREFSVPYSVSGLCVFLGIDFKTWHNYRTNEIYIDFFPTIAYVDEIIRTNQLNGATVGLFNANIVSKLLSLTERQDITSGDKPIAPTIIVQTKQTAEDLDSLK